MSFLSDIKDLFKLQKEAWELSDKERELTKELGFLAFKLYTKKVSFGEKIEKKFRELAEINKTIKEVAEELEIEIKREVVGEVPRWQKVIQKTLSKGMETVDKLKTRQRYNNLVAQGEEILLEIGNWVLPTSSVHPQLQQLSKEIEQTHNEYIQKSKQVEDKQKSGVTRLLASILVFTSSFWKYFKEFLSSLKK